MRVSCDDDGAPAGAAPLSRRAAPPPLTASSRAGFLPVLTVTRPPLRRWFPVPGQQEGAAVMPAGGMLAGAEGAAAAAEEALACLAETDATALPADTLARCLRALARAEAAHTAAQARLLAAFAAQGGPEADGHPTARSWLRW